MTTSSSARMGNSSRARYLGVGLAASVAHMLLMIPGYSENGGLQVGAYAVAFATSLVATVLVFMLVVPRAGASTALILGVVAIVTFPAFWLGITLPIAAAAVLVGVRECAAGQRTGIATSGAVLGVVGAVLTIAIIIGDATQ